MPDSKPPTYQFQDPKTGAIYWVQCAAPRRWTGVDDARSELMRLLSKSSALSQRRAEIEAQLTAAEIEAQRIDGRIAEIIRSAENAALAEGGLTAEDWRHLNDGIRSDVAAALGRHSEAARRARYRLS